MSEILMYYPLYSFVIAEAMKELNKVDADFTVRMSSPGGEVFPSYGFAKKVRELSEKGYKATLKVDGMAASMAAVLAPFFDEVEALDKAKFMFHPPRGGDKKVVKEVAADLANIYKAKLNGEKFKEITGLTIDEALDPERENSKDIWITAKDAKKIGLVHKLVSLTPALKNEIEERTKTVYGFVEEEPNNNKNSKEMNLEKLKTEHPALYNQVHDLGEKAGEKKELIRVKSWLAHSDSDLDRVKKGIKEGEELSADVREEMIVAANMKKRAGKTENTKELSVEEKEAKAKTEMDNALADDVKTIKGGM